MNKKFSTLVASLLLAGAWTTVDAKLTVTTPKIGGTYVMGTNVTASTATVDGWVTGLNGISTGVVSEFGTEWTLEQVVDADGKDITGQFNLKNSKGQYLVDAGNQSVADSYEAGFTEKKEDAAIFKLAGNAIQVVDGKGSETWATYYLGVQGNVLRAVGSNTAAIDAFATFTVAPALATGISLLEETGSDYYFVGQTNPATDKDPKVLAQNGSLVDYTTIAAADYDKYLWKVSKTETSNRIIYTFTNKADKNVSLSFDANQAYDKGFNLSGVFGNKAAGLYLSPVINKTVKDLNDLLGGGFDLTIKKNKDDKSTIAGLDVFAGKLTAVGANGVTRFQLQNSDEDYIVLDKTATWTSGNVGEYNRGAKFVVVDEDELYGENAANYYSYFEFKYNAGAADPKGVNLISVYNVATAGTPYGNLFIQTLGEEVCLTTSTNKGANESWPYIVLEADNIVPVKDLVGKFWSFTYADSKVNAKKNDEEYKYAGILVTKRDNNVADYVPASSVFERAPEAFWGVTAYDPATNTVTLKNRESGETILNVQFRKEGNGLFSVISNNSNFTRDLIAMTALEDPTMFDGFKRYSENDVRNNNFLLGQYHAIDGNNHAYFVENHGNSHQIGMTAEEGKADSWNLRFATREVKIDGKKQTVVDTLFVTTSLLKLKADGVTSDGTTDSRLAILPYTFQKVSNREFVDYNYGKGAEYYACDENNKKYPEYAARFALKMKADSTIFNFVEIDNYKEDDKLSSPDKDNLSSNKVYVANSENKGSLKKMPVYAEDNNSLMVVEKNEAPEYHKIALEWGDTISLARKENASQVLFEKGDVKSVVANDTLSFLNIDNVNQFDINPAIFADTAYINRGEGEEANTCWQYLLAVRQSYGYHKENCNNPSHPTHVSDQIDTVYGDFLVNLVDTANIYGINNIHNNPYINEDEAGEWNSKLAFVSGYHTNDTLYIVKAEGDTVKLSMDTPDFNVAKFAFRYTDSDAKTFKIQTQYKTYVGDWGYDTAEEIAEAYEDGDAEVSNEGYLKWINGTVVVVNGFEKGDEFVISEGVDRAPTANDEISVSEVSVVTTNGAVIVKGAEGKNVVITNVLGQQVANTVVSSSEATIAVPAGMVVVAVEGEAAVKAIVK